MADTNPRYRRPLNSKQLYILHLLYRFRFVTSDLLTKTLNLKDKSKMNQRLKVLTQQEYIGRKYEPHYSLTGKHAIYYLLPKGIAALKQIRDEKKYVTSALHNLHKDKTAKDQFAEHSLDVFKTYNRLADIYSNNLTFFSKSELAKYSHYFPKPLPDAYIRLEVEGDVKQYFIEIAHTSKPLFIVTRRVKQYVEYSDDGEWENTKTLLPAVLLICDTPTLQKRLQKIMPIITEDADTDELKIYTTTMERLNNADKPTNDAIWLNAVDGGGELSLRNI